jgi:hypothetical protein
MNIMVSDLYDALMSAGADEAKARRAAEGIATSDQEFKGRFSELREDNQKMRTEMAELRGTLRTEMTELRSTLQREMQQTRGEQSTMKWMMGVFIGIGVALLVRSLFP